MNTQAISLSRKKIVIVTHKSRLPVIPGSDLKKFVLLNKCNSLLYITHPLLYLKDSVKLKSEYEIYKKEALIDRCQAFHWMLPESLLMVKDFIYTVFWVIRTNQTYDIFFGLNNLNAMGGLVL